MGIFSGKCGGFEHFSTRLDADFRVLEVEELAAIL